MPIYSPDPFEIQLDQLPTVNDREEVLMRCSGYHAHKTITLSANNTTAQENIYQITGSIKILRLTAEVVDATTLTNCTGVSIQAYDGTNTVQVTSVGGATISGFTLGSFLEITGDSSVAISAENASQCRLIEASTGPKESQGFTLTQKNGSNTYVRFQYSTTDAPINAQIKAHCDWIPVCDTGSLTAV